MSPTYNSLSFILLSTTLSEAEIWNLGCQSFLRLIDLQNDQSPDSVLCITLYRAVFTVHAKAYKMHTMLSEENPALCVLVVTHSLVPRLLGS